MPYILKQLRDEFAHDNNRWAETSGELNYNFTIALGIYGPSQRAKIIIDEFINRYIIIKGLNYQTCNDIMGVLFCMQFEIPRRRGYMDKDIAVFLLDITEKFYKGTVAPYEDKKIEANGDLEVFKG